jgi:hypothetical protein
VYSFDLFFLQAQDTGSFMAITRGGLCADSHQAHPDGSLCTFCTLVLYLQAQDTGSFLAITLGSALIHTKRNFDRLMQAQLRSIEDCKPPKRQR